MPISFIQKSGCQILICAILFLMQASFASAEENTLDTLTSKLESKGGFTVRLPDNAKETHPVVLIAHGCNGIDQVEALYSDAAIAEGWATVIIDSMGPRGLDNRLASATLVCTGAGLSGQDRAKDILAAINFAKSDNRLDTSNIVLLGFSHGGWAVLDFLSDDGSNSRDWLKLPKGDLGFELKGAFVNYPFCGTPTRIRRKGKVLSNIPIKMNLAEKDTITFSRPCKILSEKLLANGANISTRVFAGTTHAFDEPANINKRFGRKIYDAEATTESLNDFKALLQSTALP